jgi:hypothetical protein
LRGEIRVDIPRIAALRASMRATKSHDDEIE